MAIASVAGVLLYVSVVNNSYYKFTDSPNRYGIHRSMLHNPTGAVDFIRQNHITGRAFSDYFVSSYLLWALYPDFKSFIDLRDLDIFPEKFFDKYFSMYEDPKVFHELDKKYNFNYVVISTSQLSALQHNLYWGEGFNQVYVDPVTVIYLKTNQENSRINDNWGLQKLFTWPQQAEDPGWAFALNNIFNPAHSYEREDEIHAPVYSAMYYNELGNYPLAIKQLLPAMYDLGDDADANFTLGNAYMQYAQVVNEPGERRRKLDSAYNYIEKSRQLNPRNAKVYSGLANLALMSGDYPQAISYLEKSIAINDDDAYIHFLAGLCYRVLWKKGEAKYRDKTEKEMNRSLELNPENTRAYLYLAEIESSKNKIKPAKTYLQSSLEARASFTSEEDTLLHELEAKLNIK